MKPKLDEKYDIEIEVTSKSKPEYLTDEYFALDLPVAPAVMVGEEIITEGKDVEDYKVEAAICRQLGLPEPGRQERQYLKYCKGGIAMGENKIVSIMVFHDELCQVFNGLMTALSLQRAGAEVTVFFGSRGINAVHKEKINDLKCLPDQPEEEQKKVMDRMETMNLPMPEDMLLMLHMEGAKLLACPLNKSVFEFEDDDFIEGVTVADPETYYTDIVMKADMNLVF